MRKFFVFAFILGMFTVAAQLTSAELPTWVTATYPEEDYLIQPAMGNNLDQTVHEAKKELIRSVFQDANGLLNPRQQQVKNKWVPAQEQRLLEQQYNAALYNLENMRAANSHLARHFQQASIQPPASNTGGYTFVNVKRQELMRAYVKREQQLQEQINVILAEAAKAEAINQQRALEAYLQTYPLYEELKEAVLIQQAVMPQREQDPAAIYKKLLETATGTNNGSLRMPLPEVNKRVNQLQHQGRLMQTMDDIAGSILQQIAVQTRGFKKGEITLRGFTYKSSHQSIEGSYLLREMLKRKLEQDGWKIYTPPPGTKGMQRREVSFSIQGKVWEGDAGSGGTFHATIHDSDTGSMKASSTLNLVSDLVDTFKPGNYNKMQETETALDALSVSTSEPQWITAQASTTQALKLEAWTDQQVENSSYREGDLMTVYCQVNQPAYIRLVYVLADSKYTLLHDSTHIDGNQVGIPVTIGEFVATGPPFGSEMLIIMAQKEPFSNVETLERDGYYYLNAQDAYQAVNMLAPPVKGMKIPRSKIVLNVQTEK